MEAVCVMYTNSVNMELGPGHGAATAFYPVFAHMNHDCGCNTQTVKLPRCGPSQCNDVSTQNSTMPEEGRYY